MHIVNTLIHIYENSIYKKKKIILTVQMTKTTTVK